MLVTVNLVHPPVGSYSCTDQFPPLFGVVYIACGLLLFSESLTYLPSCLAWPSSHFSHYYINGHKIVNVGMQECIDTDIFCLHCVDFSPLSAPFSPVFFFFSVHSTNSSTILIAL